MIFLIAIVRGFFFFFFFEEKKNFEAHGELVVWNQTYVN